MPLLAPSGVKVKTFAYEEFMGVDVSRDRYALDTGQQQHLVKVNNGFCDMRGSMVRDHGVFKRGGENQPIDHLTFYGRDLAVYARRDGGGITLASEAGHEVLEVFPLNNVVVTTVFNGKVQFACRDQKMWKYDGIKFSENKSERDPRAGIITSIQRRLAISGIADRPTEIWFTRVDNEDIMPQDEAPGTKDVTRAAMIDVKNLIGTADYIKGLGVFETNRLAVFTNDQTLIYAIDPSYERWALDDKANVRVGTLSHRTIQQAGSDLLFCSRSGVHSLRRSDANGTTIYSLPMSTKVEDVYRALVDGVENHEQISAVFDQDNGQYHIFFPQPGGKTAKRLTLTINPIAGGEHKWSTSDFLNTRCGAMLGGTTLFGTSGGIYQVARRYQYTDKVLRKKMAIIQPKMVAETPLLWHGSLSDVKDTYSFILQATGTGKIDVEAFDEFNKKIWGETIVLDDSGLTGDFPDVPLSYQYERPFQFRYRGVWFRFTGHGDGVIKIIGFAVTVRA